MTIQRIRHSKLPSASGKKRAVHVRLKETRSILDHQRNVALAVSLCTGELLALSDQDDL